MRVLRGSFVLCFIFAGCGSSPPACWGTGDCPVDTACDTDAQCASGGCISGLCVAPCGGSTSCAAGEACVRDSNGNRCRSDCTEGSIIDANLAHLVCQGGSVVACSALASPEDFCNVCGCAGGAVCSSTFCSDTSPCACFTPQPVGGPCEVDIECASQNCSSFSRTCRVAAGAPCTASDCDFCQSYSDGTSYCSRLCTHQEQVCGGGATCLGFPDIDHYVCDPSCSGPSDTSCAGTCRLDGGGVNYFCSCSGTCSVLEADHAPLAPCAAYGGTHCASGACLGRSIMGVANTFTWGYCSDPCATDADCGAAGRCVDVPCTAGDTPICGLQCLPACDASSGCYGRGTCTLMPDASGSQAMVCFVAPS